MTTQIELVDKETLALTFPYDADVVAQLKRLQNRRWNPKARHWEVHLSQLAEVMNIFGLTPRDVDERILDPFRRNWSRVRLKVSIDPVHCRLSGSGAPLTDLDNATSFYVPGYKFSPKYLKKKWDGKRHLLNRRSQSLPAGLWPRVRDILDGHEVIYEVEAKRAPVLRRERRLQTAPVRTALRPYQAKALKAALKDRRGIVQMATGGGKTLLAAHLIRELGRPAFFFVHTLELLYQAAEMLAEELGVEIGILGDGQASLRPVTVTTVQTAGRAFEEAGCHRTSKPKNDEQDEPSQAERPLELDEATRRQIVEAIEAVPVVIFDECHHVPADTFYRLAQRTGSAHWRFGLSATPWRDDQNDMLLEAALGKRIHVTNCSDLIDRGFLVPPRIRMVAAPRIRDLRRGMAYADCYQLAIVENQERNRVIATQASQWAAEGLSVLILVNHIAHGRALLELLPGANFAYGALDSQTRQRFLKELEQKLQPVMIATTLADEGLDLPGLGALVLAGGGKSQTRAYQRIGRALRPAPDKSEALVLDFVDEAPYLLDHSRARIELYRQEARFIVEEMTS